MANSIKERASRQLGLEQYKEVNLPERVGFCALTTPEERCYYLRCPVRMPGTEIEIPDELKWAEAFVDASLRYQYDSVGVVQPYMYLTSRHGTIESTTDDEWHVDGFSMRVEHPPEQNYLWTNVAPTEYLEHPVSIPEDFDPLEHNLQSLIQDSLPSDVKPLAMEPEVIYAADPYVIHRRPILPKMRRTFLRLSFVPIPINDKNNSINPAFGEIETLYDGVADFRQHLKRYPI